MISNAPLFITDISYVFFFFLTTIFGIWVYLKSSRKTSHVMFLLMTLAVGVYQISHVLGTGVSDPEASRSILMLSLSLIFVISFTVHWIAAVVEREREYLRLIVSMYCVGVALAAFYMAYPFTFLLPSEAKLYFPSYYVAGSLYWVFILYFFVGFAAVMRMLVKAYRVADQLHRNRLAYYIAAILVGFPLGSTGFLLSYGIDFDPIYSTLFNLFIAPLAYGVLRYDIMDIKAAARKALAYVVFVAGTAVFIVGSNLGTRLIQAAYPFMPDWIVPLASSLAIVLFAGYIWERMRDLEVLKYEFITVVTHKFRTPLTRIKWASEILKRHALSGGKADPDEKSAVAEIEDANEHLVVLTDMLSSLRKASQAAYQYEFESADLNLILDKSIRSAKKHIKDKGIHLTLSCPGNPIFASIDKRRMLFALQIVVENAVTYTPRGGSIEAGITADAGYARLYVRDSGIGIDKDDLSRLFSKFWRSKEAKSVDTEGMGIGLFMAKEIAERHGGDISASSEGVGKGSTFTIKIPLASD